MSRISGYQDIIMAATGCRPEEASDLEEIMRDDIFHSTLDWQTREQLEDAAREAVKIRDALNDEPQVIQEDTVPVVYSAALQDAAQADGSVDYLMQEADRELHRLRNGTLVNTYGRLAQLPPDSYTTDPRRCLHGVRGVWNGRMVTKGDKQVKVFVAVTSPKLDTLVDTLTRLGKVKKDTKLRR